MKRKDKTMKHTITALAAALFLAACATPPAIDTTQLPATPTAFREGAWTTAAPAEAQPRGAWWKAFGDPVLDGLVERADAGNSDIRRAAARLAQARALARSADADRAPQVSLGAGVGRDNTTTGRPQTFGQAGASLAYEVDLFGRLSQAAQAAALDTKAEEALLRSARLLAQAETAQAYLALRAVDEERRIVRETLAAYADTVSLTERRQRAGDIAELDAVRVRGERAAVQAEGLALDRRRAVLEHALAVLVGEPASGFTVPEADWTTALPAIPAGVPSTVLARRSDVSAAMARLEAARSRVGAAQAAWFPSLALTASGGFASSELSDLFRSSARAWGVGALLALPLFDGGRRQAGVDAARAQLDGALTEYRASLLVAFKDVEDELAARRLLADEAQAQGEAVDAAVRATTLSNTRWRNGLVSQLEFLDARRTELRQRRQAVQVRAAQLASAVALVRALGGGWEVAPERVAAAH